jgi:hypothetical protein
MENKHLILNWGASENLQTTGGYCILSDSMDIYKVRDQVHISYVYATL